MCIIYYQNSLKEQLSFKYIYFNFIIMLRFTCLQNHNLWIFPYLYTVQRKLSQDIYKNNKFIN